MAHGHRLLSSDGLGYNTPFLLKYPMRLLFFDNIICDYGIRTPLRWEVNCLKYLFMEVLTLK